LEAQVPTPNSIAELAYKLWVERGRPHGSAEQDWLEAERQIAEQGDYTEFDARVKSLEGAHDGWRQPSGRQSEKPRSDDAQEFSGAASGEVTLSRSGKTYAARYSVEDDRVKVKTHTETRSIELGNQDPAEIARGVLEEIVDAQPRK
jgi:hypothetical protein